MSRCRESGKLLARYSKDWDSTDGGPTPGLQHLVDQAQEGLAMEIVQQKLASKSRESNITAKLIHMFSNISIQV